MYFPKKTHVDIPACYVRNYQRVLLGWRLILSKFDDPTWGVPQIWTFPVDKSWMHWKGAAQVFILSGHTRIFKLLQVMFIASVALLTQKNCRSQKRHQSLSFNSQKNTKKVGTLIDFLWPNMFIICLASKFFASKSSILQLLMPPLKSYLD